MVDDTHTEHESTTSEEWDFPPLYPAHPEEKPEEFRKHPESNEAFAAWVESQCGPTNDKQPVEQYDGTLGVTEAFVANHESPVGNIHWNDDLDSKYDDPGNVADERWCTGTLVSEDLFLTAGHCFDQDPYGWQPPKDDGQTIPPHEIATNMHVDFNYQVDPSGNLRQIHRHEIEELVEYRVGGLDYAVVRLQGSPGNTFGTADLATTDAQNGDTLCIIQHPDGSPKRIEAGTATHIHGSSAPAPQRFGYDDIDTLGGSSGSGILRSPDGRIVGVHTRGGCGGFRSGHNHGVKIGEILDASSVLPPVVKPPFADGKRKVDDDKLKFTDEGKLPFQDGDGTVKHVDDRKTAGLDKQFDDGGKPPGIDGPGGDGTVKHVDDRKTAGLDKQFNDGGKQPGVDGGFGGTGGLGGNLGGAGGGQPGARPFILQTPHHMSGSGSGHQQQGQQPGQDRRRLVAQYESLLGQYERLHQQLSTQLSTVEQQYRQLRADYESLTRDTGGGRR